MSVHKTESPPEVHALNGVAERAIRSIFAHVRSDLEASGAPRSFWPFAASHACDILNRTTCPPHGRLLCAAPRYRGHSLFGGGKTQARAVAAAARAPGGMHPDCPRGAARNATGVVRA